MPLDPAFAGLLSSLPPLVVEDATPQQIRQRFAELAANPALVERGRAVDTVADLEVDGADGRLPARVYRPGGQQARPTVVFLHGGGWVIGNLETHDGFCRELCAQVDAVVVSIDYRLAPEHRFPAGVQDCLAATRWAIDHVGELGGDAQQVVVAGDSAGGNLAAVVASQLAGDGVRLAAQLLVYPATDISTDYPSRAQFAQGYFLEQNALELFLKSYVTDPGQVTDPRMSPLLFDRLELLPPTAVVTTEFDPLRDQGETYADALRAAGVPVRHRRFDGLVHGFAHFGPFVPAAQAAIDETCRLLREVLDGA